MTFYVYYGNIQLFEKLCLNFDCPLLLHFKKHWAAFLRKCPKRYILLCYFIILDKIAIIRLSIFNGFRRNNLGFFTVCITLLSWTCNLFFIKVMKMLKCSSKGYNFLVHWQFDINAEILSSITMQQRTNSHLNLFYHYISFLKQLSAAIHAWKKWKR